ncbi:MAG: hypothetical protein Q7S81_00545 [bacterium]|nr:hypothetical protein [bacterium]
MKRKDKKQDELKGEVPERKSLTKVEKALKLIALLIKGDCKELFLKTELQMDEITLRDMAQELGESGYNIHVFNKGDENIYTLVRGENVNTEAIPISFLNKKFKIGLISDPRMGSKKSQISLLHGIYKDIFEKEDVDLVIVTGDLVNGKPTTRTLPDALITDPDELIKYVVKHFPKTKKFKTYIVSGRAELTWKNEKGVDTVSAICKQREDLRMAGDLERTFNVKGVNIKVSAPFDDNSPMSVSYGPQKMADKLKDDPMPDIFVIGGTHRRSYIPTYNGMYIVTTPSLHLQTKRQERKAVTPYIGCSIIELNYNEDWSIDLGGGGLKLHHIGLEKYADPNDCYGADLASKAKLSQKGQKVLDWFLKEEGFTLTKGELARRLGEDKGSVDKIIAELKKCGCVAKFDTATKQLHLEVGQKKEFAPTSLNGEEVFVWATKEAGISDTHLGSNKDNPAILRKAYEDAAKARCRRVYNAGDIPEGAGSTGYRGHLYDMRPGCVSLDDLGDYMVANWPKDIMVKVDPKHPMLVSEMINFPDGKIGYKEKLVKEGSVILQTDAIEGNHDGWAQKTIGTRMVRTLAMRLNQCIRYVGYLVGSVTVDGIYHKLVHPEGGSGSCLSNVVEKHLKKVRESKESGGLPEIVYIGHYHSAYFLYDTRVGIRMPCLKDEDVFHETHALLPFIGMFITEVFLDKSGKNITRVVIDYRNYYPLMKKSAIKETHL